MGFSYMCIACHGGVNAPKVTFESFYFWLFGGKKKPEELEQRTSLQRAVAEKLRRGEPIGSARGFLAFLK